MLPADLKQYLVVTGVIDGEKTELSSEQYDVATESGFLNQGSCTVTISSGNLSDTVTIPDVTLVNISSLQFDTTGLGDIFITTSNEEVGERLVVTAVFANGHRQELSSSMYTVNFNRSVGAVTFTVGVDFNGRQVNGSFTYEVSELKLESIRAEQDPFVPIKSSMNEYTLHDALNVYGKFNDGQEYELPAHGFDYVVEGSLLAGPEKKTEPYQKTITVKDSENGSDVEPIELTVSVTSVEVTSIEARDQRKGTYQAYTQVDNAASSFSVTAYFVDGGEVTLSPGDYTITYEGVQEGEPQSFRVGHGTITIRFVENGGPEVTDSISGYTIVQAQVVLPGINEGTFNYGDEANWQMWDYDDRLKIDCTDGLDYKVEGTNVYFTANQVGEYTVVVRPLNDSISLVDSSGNQIFENGENKKTFTLEILPANYDITISLDENIVAGHDGYITITLTGPDGEPVELPQGITYTYSGTNMLDEEVVDGVGIPTDAGHWVVYVNIPASGNFTDSGKYTDEFTINKVVHQAPNPVDIPYDGTQHRAEFEEGTDTNFFEVSGEEHIDVGVGYSSMLTIKDDCWNNHSWEDGDRDISVVWGIVSSENTLTSDPIIDGWTFGEHPASPTSTARFGDSSDIVYTFSKSKDDPDSYKTMDGIDSWDAGQWYMKATTPTDGKNYTSVTSKPVSFSIAKLQVGYPGADDTAFIYTGETQTYSPEGYDESYMDMIITPNETGDEAGKDAGSYTVTIKLDNNHGWDSTSVHDQLDEDGDPVFTWTIEKAVNKVEGFEIEGWTFGSVANNPTGVELSFGTDYTFGYSKTENGEFLDADSIVWSASQSGGDYWYVCVTSGSSDNYESDTLTKSFLIAKLPVDYPGADGREFEYTGNTQMYNPTGFDDSYMDLTVMSVEVSDDPGKDAGSYTVTITLDGNHEWDVNSPHDQLDKDGNPVFTWVIGKKGIDATLNERDLTYNNVNQKPEIVSDYDDLFIPSWGNETSTEIGDYEVYLKITDFGNYEWDHDAEGYGDSVNGDTLTLTYRIVGQTYNLKIQIGGGETASWTYGGDHPDVTWNTGLPEDIGTILEDDLLYDKEDGWYLAFTGMDGTSYSSHEWPTEVGTYSVYLHVSETDTYADKTSNMVTFTINPAEITGFEISEHGWTYDAESHTVLYNGTTDIVPSAVTVNGMTPSWQYAIAPADSQDWTPDENDWRGPDEISVTNSGTYTIWYRVSADNHGSETGSFTLTVTEATITGIEFPTKGWTYDGSEHDVLWDPGTSASGEPSGTTVGDVDIDWTYSTEKDGEYSDVLPSFKDAGDHTVYYRATAINHELAEGEFHVSISKRSIDLSFGTSTYTYSNSEPTDVVWNFSLDGSDVCEGDDADTLKGAVMITVVKDGVTKWNVGDYDVTATISDNNYVLNYDGNDKLQITKRPLSLNDSRITYGDAAPSLSEIIGNIADGDGIADAIPSGNADFDGYSQGSDHGEYTISTGSLVTGDNYSLEIAEAATLTVAQRAITVSIQNESSTYGDELEILTGTVPDGGVFGSDKPYRLYLAYENGGEIVDIANPDAGTYWICGERTDDNYIITFEGKSTGDPPEELDHGLYVVTPRSVTIGINTGFGSMPYTGDVDRVKENASSLFEIQDDPTETYPEPDLEFREDGVVLGYVPTDVGTYTVRPVYTSDPNYAVLGNIEVTFSITEIDYELDLDWVVKNNDQVVSEYEFNGKEYIVILEDGTKSYAEGSTVVTGIDGEALTVSYTINGGGAKQIIDADSYTVLAEFHTDSKNYNTPANMTYTLEVTPKEVYVVWVQSTGSNNHFEYDGTDQKGNVTAHYLDVRGDEVYLSVNLDGEFKTPRKEAYTFTASFDETDSGRDNYKLVGMTEEYYMDVMQVTIEVADNTDDVHYGDAIDVSDFSYSVTSGKILSDDLRDGESILLYVDTTVTGTSLLPRPDPYPDAIKCTVPLKNAYYNISYDYGDLTINKRPITFTIPDITTTYDGHPAELGTLGGSDGSDALSEYVTSGSLIPTDNIVSLTLCYGEGGTQQVPTDAGTYEDSVWCVWNNDRYDITVIPGDLIIKRDTLDVTVNPQNPSAIFNDDQQSPDVSYSVVGVNSLITLSHTDYTVQYKVDGSYAVSIPSFRDSGEHTVEFKIVPNSNNYEPKEGSFVFKITGTTNSFTQEFHREDWTYREGVGTYTEPISKFGEPVIRIYTDESRTTEYEAEITNDTPAGTYYVRVTVEADGENYPELVGDYEFTVSKAVLRYSWSPGQSITYTGDTITNTLTVGHWNGGVGENIAIGETGDSTVMYTNPGASVSVVEGSLSMSAVEVGEYSLSLTINDFDNYVWNGVDSSIRTIETSWSIVLKLEENGWFQEPGITDIIFGESLAPVGEPFHGEPTFYYSTSETGSFNSTVEPTQVGKYYMLVVVPAVTDGGVHYGRMESEPIEFEIGVRQIDVPTTSYEVEFSPGVVQTVTLGDLGMDVEDQPYVTISNNTGTSAKTYTAILSLADTKNCTWKLSDGTTTTDNQIIDWEISPMGIDYDSQDFIDNYDGSEDYDYDTELKVYTPTFYESAYMEISGNTGRDAGNYVATITLTSTDYRWNGTEERSVSVDWNIDPKELIVPMLKYDENSGRDLTITYGGSDVTVAVEGFDAKTMGVVTHGATLSSSADGVTTTVGIGGYSFDISLKTENYVWKGEDAEERSITLNLYVSAQIVDKPTVVEDEFDYDGGQHSIQFDNTLNLDVDGNSQRDAGTYSVSVTPSDGYYWSDGSSDAITFTLTINAISIILEVKGEPTATYGEDIPVIDWTYVENSGTFVNGDSPNVTIYTDAEKGDDVGEYPIRLTADAGDNYIVTCIDGTLEITPAEVKLPPVVTDRGSEDMPELTYNGDLVTFDPEEQWGEAYDGSLMSVRDNTGTDIGVQTSYLFLKDTHNYVWSNGGSSEIEFYWEISRMPATITIPGPDSEPIPGIPEGTVDLGDYEATGQPLNIQVGGFDSTYMRVVANPAGCYTVDPSTGVLTITAKDPGHYVISFYLVNEHYEWSSSAAGIMMMTLGAEPDLPIMTFEFDIVSNPEGEEYAVSAGNNSFVYNGQARTYTPTGFDPDHMEVSGTTSATTPGTYTVTLSLKDPIDHWASLDDDRDGIITITWSITKKSITLTAESGSMSVGGEPPELRVLGTDGFVDDGLADLFSVSLDEVEYDTPGEYSVSVVKNGDCSALGYYDIRYVDGKVLVMEGRFPDFFTLDGVTDPETYRGSPITKPISSSALVEGSDYTVTYADNTDVGTATVTISGLNDYSDQILSFQFQIVKADPLISFDQDSVSRYPDDGTFTNRLNMPSYVTTAGSSVYSSSSPSVASVDPATGLVTVGSVGTATITVTVPGTENYNDSSASFTVVVSETPVVVVPGDGETVVVPVPVEKWYQKDVALYILLIVIVSIGFALYILYTVWSRKRNQ